MKWNGEERRKMSARDEEEMKRITKEALKEWLDSKFAQFGHWTFTALMSVAFAGLIYFILKSNGWTKH
jgi:hypothetical protein